MTKEIKNITTTIASDEMNPLIVKWDLEIEYDEAHDNPSNCTQVEEDGRMVTRIRSVEVLLFDKTGVDVTEYFKSACNIKSRLENALLEEVEFETMEDLIEANLTDSERNLATQFSIHHK